MPVTTRLIPATCLSEKDQARFWSKVALPNEQGCMLWMDKPNQAGYGQLNVQGRVHYAHRLSYALAYGGVPAALVIDHVKTRGCTNRRCMAPEHLEAITQVENLRRIARPHCGRGHPFTEANTYRRPDTGVRQCRACAVLRRQAACAAQNGPLAHLYDPASPGYPIPF